MTPLQAWSFSSPQREARGPGSRWIRIGGLGLLGALVLSLHVASAAAATSNSSFSVTATVVATCVVSATALAFGNYTGVQSDSTATLSMTCTNTTPYNIGLGVGLAPGATVTTRKMTGPLAAVLPYALFSDTDRALNWGNTVATDTVAGTGSGSVQTLTIYGRIASGLYVAPGAYTDTVTATVTY
jgi:spore coat protein U-like protein